MRNKPRTIAALIFAIILFGISLALLDKKPEVETPLLTVVNPTPIAAEEKTVTILFAGDIMLARDVATSVARHFGGDYGKLFEKIPEIKIPDITFANLEGPVSDLGHNVGSIYSFRMDPLALPSLKNGGIDIVSFANNHVGDYTVAAFTDTLDRLDANGILHVGAGHTKSEAEAPVIIDKNGIRIGFIGFSDVGPNWLAADETTPGILLASDPQMPEIIAHAKAQCDILVTSFHWGIEYQPHHSAEQEFLAHTAIDSGADFVIGHHPHVEEDTENYKNGFIAYSLGNFIFDQPFSKQTMQGLVVEATLDKTHVTNIEKKHVYLNAFYQPERIGI